MMRNVISELFLFIPLVVGLLLTPALATALGWPAACVIYGATGVAYAAIAWKLLPESAKAPPKVYPKP